jgi:hypothetical protein
LYHEWKEKATNRLPKWQQEKAKTSEEAEIG